MLSVLAQSPALPNTNGSSTPVAMQEFDDLPSALEPFAQLIMGASRATKLHCTVPTWSGSSDCCLDDLHDLRTRTLSFLHTLLTRLRASGVQVSYQLAPSCSTHVALRALAAGAPPRLSAEPRLPATASQSHAFMALVDRTPTLIIS